MYDQFDYIKTFDKSIYCLFEKKNKINTIYSGSKNHQGPDSERYLSTYLSQKRYLSTKEYLSQIMS